MVRCSVEVNQADVGWLWHSIVHKQLLICFDHVVHAALWSMNSSRKVPIDFCPRTPPEQTHAIVISDHYNDPLTH